MVKAGLKKLGAGIVLAMLLVVGGAMAADAPSKGLGARWPNAQDVSQSASWHVYVFARDGVKYIQVNDAAGNVRGAVAASADGATAVALPLGTGELSVTGGRPVNGAVIYDDGTTTVTQMSDGLLAAPTAATFRAADCSSVADCSKVVN